MESLFCVFSPQPTDRNVWEASSGVWQGPLRCCWPPVPAEEERRQGPHVGAKQVMKFKRSGNGCSSRWRWKRLRCTPTRFYTNITQLECYFIRSCDNILALKESIQRLCSRSVCPCIAMAAYIGSRRTSGCLYPTKPQFVHQQHRMAVETCTEGSVYFMIADIFVKITLIQVLWRRAQFVPGMSVEYSAIIEKTFVLRSWYFS